MATDEDTQSRLDRILIRVQSGEPLTSALDAENCYNWFYRKVSRLEQAPIYQARAEYQARVAQYARQGSEKAGHRSEVVSGLYVEVLTSKKQEFKALCDSMGTTITKRMATLITNDINSHRNGGIF